MGNGYDVLVYGVLNTFLLGHAEHIKRDRLSPGGRTSAI